MPQADTGDWRAGVARCIESSPRPVHFIGVGNALRSDDASGIAVVSSLRRSFGIRPPDWVRFDADGPVERVASRIPLSDGVVLFDAVRAGAGAGSIICATLADTDYGFFATHNVPLRLVPGLAERGRSAFVIGIVPASLEVGEGLTPKVSRSVGALAAEVVKQVRSRS